MALQEKARWKNWADGLRQQMMTGLTAEVTKSVEAIASETATGKAESTLHSVRFWTACQKGDRPNEFLAAAGFDIEFEPDDRKRVNEVTLRLNKTWMGILQQVLDRQQV
jgi:hypothetical protein